MKRSTLALAVATALVALLLLAVAPAPSIAQSQPTRPLTFTSTIPQWQGRNKASIAVLQREVEYTRLDGSVHIVPIGGFVFWGGYGNGFNSTLDPEPSNSNDVWLSTDGLDFHLASGRYYDPTSQQFNSSRAPENNLKVRVGSTGCSDNRGFLYQVGGEYWNGSVLITVNDVYRSTDGGLSWTHRAATGLRPRSYANCIFDSSNNLYVMSGNLDYFDREGDPRNPANDVVRSTNGGNSFTVITENAPYVARCAAGAVAVRDYSRFAYERIFYVIGGWGENATDIGLRDDVWYSVDLGRTWSQVTEHASWPRRADPTLVASDRGFLVLVGGRAQSASGEWNVVNDIYLSSDGGRSWYKGDVQSVTPRIFPAAVITPDVDGGTRGLLVIASGGYTWDVYAARNDVFKSTLEFDEDFVETQKTFGLPLSRYTSSCVGLFACTNELEFAAVTIAAPWAPRNKHDLRVLSSSATVRLASGVTRTYPAGSWLLFGGLPIATANDVWITSDNSASWQKVVSFPSRRAGGCFAVTSQNRFFITSNVLDTWYDTFTVTSTDFGSSWTPYNTTTVVQRHWHNCVVDSSDNLYVLNGFGRSSALNDIFVSRDGGKSYSIVSSAAPYSRRAGSAVVLWPKNEKTGRPDYAWVLGGWDLTSGSFALDDVWLSTDGLRTWTEVSPKNGAEWNARFDHSVAVNTRGVLVLTGGVSLVANTRYSFNDVWVSLDGGVNWEVVEDAAYTPRNFPRVLFVNNGDRLLVVGGASEVATNGTSTITQSSLNDVWLSGSLFNNIAYVKQITEWSNELSCIGPQQYCSLNPDSAYLTDDSSTASSVVVVIAVVIAVPLGLLLIWATYSVRVHGEVRIPFTERSCNCCDSALRRDTLFDDEFALHKGTGKYKNSVNNALVHHRLMDD